MMHRTFMLCKRSFDIHNVLHSRSTHNITMYVNQNIDQSRTMKIWPSFYRALSSSSGSTTKELWIYNNVSNLIKTTDEDKYLEKRREFFEKVYSLETGSEQTIEICKIAEKIKGHVLTDGISHFEKNLEEYNLGMKSVLKDKKEMNFDKFSAYVSFTDLNVSKELFIASSRYADIYLCTELHERRKLTTGRYYDVFPFETYKVIDHLTYLFMMTYGFQIIIGNTEYRLWYIVGLSIIIKFAVSQHYRNNLNDLFFITSYNYNMKKYID